VKPAAVALTHATPGTDGLAQPTDVTSRSPTVTRAWNDVVDFFHGLWEQIVPPIEKGWQELSDAFRKGVEFIVGKLQDLWKWIQDIIHKIQPEKKPMQPSEPTSSTETEEQRKRDAA